MRRNYILFAHPQASYGGWSGCRRSPRSTRPSSGNGRLFCGDDFPYTSLVFSGATGAANVSVFSSELQDIRPMTSLVGGCQESRESPLTTPGRHPKLSERPSQTLYRERLRWSVHRFDQDTACLLAQGIRGRSDW